MNRADSKHIDRRAAIKGAALTAAAAALAAVPSLAVAVDDPLPALVERWLSLYAAVQEADRDWDRRAEKMRALGLPDNARVQLSIYRSEEDDQEVTATFGYSEKQINQFYDQAPERWRASRDRSLERFRQIKARWDDARQRLGLPEAEQHRDAIEEVLAPVEQQIIDTKPTTLAGVVAKLRFAMALGWNDERPSVGPTLEHQAPEVRAIAEVIAFLEPLVKESAPHAL